ncbi:shikimate dehydrogenase [Pararhodobacter zhoushanensis]|uniref:Shikimate dehydrogenase n=1 Tax=Pararhodobacter zhoushanensis TaxID=2479545 RepID=A0ABT3GTU4_9RHOB|nr:shikimate dehydrogenase [Pararhodobacter zhoushanensis]MCW1930924.1 shikimate dehydrogenase [Pararhodobacter zhoushanensis]
MSAAPSPVTLASPSPGLRAALIGAGIGASRTPRMHVEEGRALGLDYGYDLIDADQLMTRDIAALLDQAQADGLAGVNVTFPFKRAALDHVDSIAPSALAVGATNTVVFGPDGRVAHNTDYAGFAEGFRRDIGTQAQGCALLLGAGGAGGAVANALLDSGVRLLFVQDVDTAAAEALVTSITARLGAGRVRLAGDLRVAAAAADGIVNATPVGMAKLPGTPLDMALVEPRHWVADIVYFPLETAFLQQARAKGCHGIDGSGMAVFQAVLAFELFTGRKPDPARMRATFDSFT